MESEAFQKKFTESWEWFSQGNDMGGPIIEELKGFSTAIMPSQIWREYRPTRNSIEFTVYFRIGQTRENSMKMRADFEVSIDEFETITFERMIELSKLAMFDSCLWVVEQGRVSIAWPSENKGE